MEIQSNKIDQEHDRIFKELLINIPEMATHFGLSEIDSEGLSSATFSSYSEIGIARRHSFVNRLMEDIEAMSVLEKTREQELTSAAINFYLNYTMHPGSAVLGVQGQVYQNFFYPFDHLAGLQITLPELLVKFHMVSDTRSAEAYLDRLAKIVLVLGDAIELSETLAKRSLLPSRFVLERSCEGIKVFLKTPYKKHPLFQAYSHKLRNVEILSSKHREDYLARAVFELEHTVYPAYRLLLDSLQSHVKMASDISGLHRYKEGGGCYEFLLKSHTTKSTPAHELHDFGKLELKCLQEEIRHAFSVLNVKGSNMDELFTQLTGLAEEDSSGTDTLEQAQQVLTHISAAINKVFDLLPAADLRVAAVSPELGKDQFHHYSTPSPDHKRPGVFYFNPALPVSSWELPSLVYHETLPGHHLQLSLAQELKHLPLFRRFNRFTAYTEGWAKYAEKLPWDCDLVDQPHAHLGQLRSELMSATNLVLDTGIHHYGWEREYGVEFFCQNTGFNPLFAKAMVDRISAYPGQACAYKMGMNEFLSLRKKMSKALGKYFDIKHFHNTVLTCGALPLPLLAQVVDEEIAATNVNKRAARV